MQWEVVIGLETHVQLSTNSKIFSGAARHFGDEPNVNACVVDLALPGTLPVLNRGAVEKAIRFGLAIKAKVANRSVFDRKNYFYPDLPKGYQISQFELPIVIGGELTFPVHPKKGDPYVKTIHLTRAHLEEDAGKSIHGIIHGHSGIDLNRAGTPLLEIVTEPELRSSAEAVAYARALHALVVWLGISDGNMQEGNFRCDANVSVRPVGSTEFGTRCEIKNLNSFRFLQEAIDYEVRRQIELIEEGGKVVQATRLYDPDKGETRQMRSKEDSMDYRYFPEPDIPPLEIGEDYLERLRGEQPEMAEARMARYQADWGLPVYDTQMLTSQKALAEFFETTVALGSPPKQAANWIMGEVLRRLSADGLEAKDMTFTPKTLARLIELVQTGALNRNTAVKVFDAVFTDDGDVDAYVKEHGLEQVSDAGLVGSVVDKVLAANSKSIQDFKAGKEKAFGFLVGQVMRELKGQASPQVVNQTLLEKLEQL